MILDDKYIVIEKEDIKRLIPILYREGYNGRDKNFDYINYIGYPEKTIFHFEVYNFGWFHIDFEGYIVKRGYKRIDFNVFLREAKLKQILK